MDDRETTYWKERIQIGNGYINRHITGAIVQRQPFGGWKASTVGPGAKAGGPNYVFQLMQWTQVGVPAQQSELSPALVLLLARCRAMVGDRTRKQQLAAAAGSYLWAWQSHFSQEHDPSQVLGEANILRYRPCRGLLVRIGAEADLGAVAQVLLAIRVTGQSPTVSLSREALETWSWLADESGFFVIEEDEAGLAARLTATQAHDRLRTVTSLSPTLLRAAHASNVAVIDAPVVANGRLELRWYLREQAIAQTMHRYGNLLQ